MSGAVGCPAAPRGLTCEALLPWLLHAGHALWRGLWGWGWRWRSLLLHASHASTKLGLAHHVATCTGSINACNSGLSRQLCGEQSAAGKAEDQRSCMLCRESGASAVQQHTCWLLDVLALWERLTLNAPACLLLQALSWLEPLL
jgi:hypothetical protein